MIPYAATLDDRRIHGDAYDGPSWDGWRVLHHALDGLPPPAVKVPDWAERWQRMAGGRPWPTVRPSEAWIIAARRCGKTREIGRRSGWIAATFDRARYRFAPGEVPRVGLYAGDRQQARALLGYASGFLHGSPMLERLIDNETSEEIRLTNSVAIPVMTASFRTGTRSSSLIFAAADESGFWQDEGANPDRAVFGAVRPPLIASGGQLVSITSPHRQAGEVYRQWKKNYGQPSDRVLVCQIGWRDLNPSLDERAINDSIEDDPEQARSEWEACWREDLSTYCSRELIEAAVVPDRGDLPRSWRYPHRVALDMASGAGQGDSAAFAAGHDEGQRFVIDAIREWKPPFDPARVAAEVAELCGVYGVRRVVKDRWALGWVDSALQRHGITATPSELTKSDAYLALLPMLAGRRIELPDNPRLIAQLASLERRTGRGRGGRDSVDAIRGQPEDVANVVALVATAPRAPSCVTARVVGL